MEKSGAATSSWLTPEPLS